MGCWNGTCGISQMPIFEGDKVVLIPLVQNADTYDMSSNGGGVCYSHAYFTPFVFPIVGTYNDYGCIDLIDDNPLYQRQYEVFLEYFQFHALENNTIAVLKEHSDDGLCVDNAKNEIDTLKKLLYVMERGRLKLKKGHYEQQKNMRDGYHISYMLIHYDLYMNIINEYGNRKPYDKDFTIRTAMEGEFDELVKQIKEKIEKHKEPILAFFHINSRMYEQLKGPSYYYLFTDFFGDRCETLYEFKNEFMDFIIIQHSVDLMRKLWIPQAGSGSQSREYMLPLIVSNFITDNIDKRKKEYLEEDDDLSVDEWMRETLFHF